MSYYSELCVWYEWLVKLNNKIPRKERQKLDSFGVEMTVLPKRPTFVPNHTLPVFVCSIGHILLKRFSLVSWYDDNSWYICILDLPRVMWYLYTWDRGSACLFFIFSLFQGLETYVARCIAGIYPVICIHWE